MILTLISLASQTLKIIKANYYWVWLRLYTICIHLMEYTSTCTLQASAILFKHRRTLHYKDYFYTQLEGNQRIGNIWRFAKPYSIENLLKCRTIMFIHFCFTLHVVVNKFLRCNCYSKTKTHYITAQWLCRETNHD